MSQRIQSELYKQQYTLENLHCANCAAKIEEKIHAIPLVKQANFSFMTKQLHLSMSENVDLSQAIQEICDSVEEGVRVSCFQKEQSAGAAEGDSNVTDGHNHSHEALNLWQVGALLFGLLVLFGTMFTDVLDSKMENTLLVAAYVFLSAGIIRTAIKNLLKGQIFDENFLMTVATVGAVLIGEYPEALGVILFYRIGTFFEHRATEKNRGQIMNMIDLRPEIVRVIKSGRVEFVNADLVEVGDIISVLVGDRIPLDGIVIEGISRIDSSAVTGESVPVSVHPGMSIFSGSVNLEAVLTLRVDKKLSESMVSRILAAVENASAKKPTIDRFITRFARVYTPIVVGLALFTAIVPGFITGEWQKWIYTALTFLVISCPCALVLSIPLTFFSGIGAAAKEGILFKGGLSIERLSKIKAIAFDKTGTLTKGDFAVQRVITEGNRSEEDVLMYCASVEQQSTHPIAVSIVEAAKQKNLALVAATEVREFAGEGIVAIVNGHDVLCGNGKLFARFGVALPKKVQDESGTNVFVGMEGSYVGTIVISDTLKPEVPKVLDILKGKGINMALLTGDSKAGTQSLLNNISLDYVATGLLPEQKYDELQNLREKHGNIMFVGDGINDAPVLAGADVGAAMGTGADAAMEVADVVFMSSALDSIPKAHDLAKKTIQIAWQNIVLALGIKIIVMVMGLAGYASMWGAVFADTGVTIICILNSIRILYLYRK